MSENPERTTSILINFQLMQAYKPSSRNLAIPGPENERIPRHF